MQKIKIFIIIFINFITTFMNIATAKIQENSMETVANNLKINDKFNYNVYKYYENINEINKFYAENNLNEKIDSTVTDLANSESEIQSNYAPLTKSPTVAMLKTLALPGWGQLYVENYIRAPIFAAAAGTLWYFTISNHLKYKDFQEQMNSIEDKNSFDYQIVKNKKETANDNRDMAALYLIGIYTIAIIDAYVGAHLYDFNVNQFSVSISPQNKLLTEKLTWQIGLHYQF